MRPTVPPAWVPWMAAMVVLAGCAGGADPASEAMGPAITPPAEPPPPPPPDPSLFAPPEEERDIPPVTVNITITVRGRYPIDAHYEIDVTEAPTGSRIHAVLTNEDPNPGFVSFFRHGWFLQDVPESSVGTPTSGQTGNATFFAPDEPGEYLFYCTVANNRDLGMEGVFRFYDA